MSGASAFAAFYNEEKKKQGGGGGGRAKVKLSASSRTVKIAVVRSRVSSKGGAYRAGRRGGDWGQRPGRSVSTEGGKINSVAISNWVPNGSKAVGRLRGALAYNQDRERGPGEDERTFFTDRKSGLDRKDIAESVERGFGEKVAFHTVIMSPGDNSIDVKNFVRETMEKWQEELGYRVDYYGVEHRNTDHYHAHVIIPARSIDKGSDVRFDREDLENLREIGNDYIARERMLDRALDRAVEREFGLDKIDRYDREVQDDFRMSSANYREDQESVGLSTYSDYIRQQKELGLGGTYDPGRALENFGSQDKDRELINDLYSEPSVKDERSSELSETLGGKEGPDWDSHVADDLYNDPRPQDHQEYDIGAQFDSDLLGIKDESVEEPMQPGKDTRESAQDEEADRERDDDEFAQGGGLY
jgi:hypothetical protein